MKYYLYFILIVSLYIFQSCANPKSPTGGEKDITAPKIDTTFPANYSVNTKVQKFEILFDERIEINDLESNLFITPYIDNPYKSVIKKNKLTLLFENTFEDETTYTFNFGTSIQDITEKNKSKNIKYVFSTGSYIDSLKITTQALFPLTNKPCEGCLVSLYSSVDTNNIENAKPLYFAFTDKTGKAKLEYIKANEYDINVLKDENGNYMYNKGEPVAILNKSINLIENTEVESLYMINEDNRKQKIVSQKTLFDNYKLEFKKGLTSIELYDSNFTRINNIKYWFSNSYNINLSFNVNYNMLYTILAKDSLQNVDTLKTSFTEDTLSKFININSNTSINPGDSIKFEILNSITKIDTSKFLISPDSIYTKIKYLIYDSTQHSILIAVPNKMNSFLIKIDSNAISSFENINNSQKFKFTVVDETELGIISGKINCNDNYELELLDEKYKIIQSIKNCKTFNFINLKPIAYKIRLKIDANNNGIWDQGSFKNKEVPEEIIFHKENIKLRKNWEIKDINLSCPTK